MPALSLFFGLLLLTLHISAQPLLIVRGDGDYGPYEMERDGKLTGLHIEITRLISNELDLSISIKSYPWARALNMMSTGEADAILFVGKNVEREKFIIFDQGNELSWSYSALLVLKRRQREFKFDGSNISTLSQFKFGQQNNYIYGDPYDDANLKKLSFNSYDQLFGMLYLERIDIAMMNHNEFKNKQKLKVQFIDDIQPLSHLIKQINYIGFSKLRNHQSLSKEFSKTLQKFRQTSRYQKLLLEFGS